jgi:sugar/nucleoside kinase (ribokinase family)
MTPNLKEFNQMTNSEFDKEDIGAISKRAFEFKREFNIESLIITLGDKGALCCAGGVSCVVAGSKVEFSNTIGAGDTFVSAFCSGLADNMGLVEATKKGNKAAGIVVTKRYTETCGKEELDEQ